MTCEQCGGALGVGRASRPTLVCVRQSFWGGVGVWNPVLVARPVLSVGPLPFCEGHSAVDFQETEGPSPQVWRGHV